MRTRVRRTLFSRGRRLRLFGVRWPSHRFYVFNAATQIACSLGHVFEAKTDVRT